MEVIDKVNALTLEAAQGVTLPLHASAGVAAFPDDGRTYHALFEVADARMYEGKPAIGSRR